MVHGNFGPPWSGVWHLTGEIVQDGENEFIFRCDDSVMGSRGGTYHFRLLTMDKYKEHRLGWYEDHAEVMERCHTTEELHECFLKHWSNLGETEDT